MNNSEPGMGGSVVLEQQISMEGRLVALGYQKTKDDVTFPPYGSVIPNPLVVNAAGGKMVMVTNNHYTDAGITDIASLLATYDESATQWTTVLVNGVAYELKDFQISHNPTIGLWVMALFGVDFFAGLAPGAVVSVRFVY